MMKQAVIALLIFFTQLSIAAEFKEGVHYEVRPNQELSKSPEVVEYFSYGCPHCYHAEPSMKAFLAQKPEGVAVKTVPVGFFKPPFELARMGTIIAEVLGKKEALHDAFFATIHGPGGAQFRSEGQLMAFFQSNGVSKAEYEKALNSPEAQKLHVEYRKMVEASRITGVPTFIVNNKYQVGHRSGQSHEEFVALLKYLLAKDGIKATAEKK